MTGTGTRDAKVCAMRKFVANFMRLRSEAEERWNRARPVLWPVPFYFRHKNSSRRRSTANYSPLVKETAAGAERRGEERRGEVDRRGGEIFASNNKARARVQSV